MAPMSKKQLSKLGLAALAVISIAERRRKQRSTSVGRLWARPHIMARNSTGAFAKLLPVLREREPSQFRNFLRMPVTTFDWLLDLVTPLIVKEDTRCCEMLSDLPNRGMLVVPLSIRFGCQNVEDWGSSPHLNQLRLTLVVAPICHFCAVFLGSRDVTSREKKRANVT